MFDRICGVNLNKIPRVYEIAFFGLKTNKLYL